MRKIILAVLFTLALAIPTQAKQLNTTSLSHIQKLSVASIMGMTRQECYDYIDVGFRPLQLTNYFNSHNVQELTYKQCLKRNVPYSMALITFYKESSFREDAFRNYADGSVDAGIAQIHIKPEDIEKKKYLIEKPMMNVYEGIYYIHQIIERYQAYTLLEINIAYQYGFERLYDAREGIPVPKAKGFLDRLEVSEAYIEKMIKRSIIKQVLNEGKVYINKDKATTPLEEVIEY